ncbi:50S ribosomal protein L18 [Desulfobacterales bacterium HSG16]|nr:50S ribosomal protein L18 [Desulfobacterales bacterium HSG16]
MGTMNSKKQAWIKRKKRIRKSVLGTSERPRLSVFRSAVHIYAQVIDDTRGHTIASASSMEKNVEIQPTPEGEKALSNKIGIADAVGRMLGKRASEKGVKQIVFDRNGFLYHGRVKALSEGARKAGLDF